MARAGFFDVVIDPNGRPIRGVTVTVYDTGTVTPYSGTIYAGPTAATTLPNPFTANDQGEVQFWTAAPTRVDLAYSKNGYTGETETVDTSDSGALLPDAQIPATIARDAEVTAAVAAEATLRIAGDATEAAARSAEIAGLNGTYVARSGGSSLAVASLPFLNVKDYGAVGDGQWVENCQITNGSPNIAMPLATLTAADIGKRIVVQSQTSEGTGTWYVGVLTTTILSVTDATHAVMAANATVTDTASRATWGTDDTAEVQAALTAAGLNTGTTSTLKSTGHGAQVFFPPGMYLVTSQLNVPSQTVLSGVGAVAGHAHYEASGSVIRAAATMTALLRLNSTYGTRIEHLAVDGGNLATATVHWNGYQNRISQAEVRRGVSYAVYETGDVQGHENNIFDAMLAQDARGICLYTDGSSDSVADNIYVGNIMKGGTDGGIYLLESHACMLTANHTYVLPNHETLTTVGVHLEACLRTQFVGNYVDIVAGGPQLIVAGNAVQAIDTTMISDNLFFVQSANLPNNTYSHILLSAATGTVRATTITGNRFVGGGTPGNLNKYAVENAGGAISVTVLTDNLCRNVLGLWNVRPDVVSGNYMDQGGGGATEGGGAQTFSGTGSQVAFTWNHGILGSVIDGVNRVQVTPKSADAMGHYYVTVSSTQITVTYDAPSAPPSGTNNVAFWWAAGV